MNKWFWRATALVVLATASVVVSATEDSLLGANRAALVKAVGEPTAEIKDKKILGASFDNVFVSEDEESAVVSLFFLNKNKTLGVAMLSYYEADQEADLEEAIGAIHDGLEGEGFLLQKDLNAKDTDDAIYFSSAAKEYVYVNVNGLEDGSAVLYSLYSGDQGSVLRMADVIAALDDSLSDEGDK